jgi:predicted cupin superfamily sugar epimerase
LEQLPTKAVLVMTELPVWAERLDLSPHPEGGWFAETWRSDVTLTEVVLPPDYTGPRSAGTAILFLLMPGQQSAWHTVRSAELWLYHRGSPLLLETGVQKSGATAHLLGADIAAGEQPQVLVPPGHWQRARPRDDEPTLVSCVVVPGFDFADFSLDATGIRTDDRPS